MMRGMLAAVSGLKAHEVMLDVTANNIANVNTIGYKGVRTSFENAFSQTLRGASAATASIGGINAAQIGLGVQLGGTENLMTEGSIQSTGNTLDCAIQGDGFFRVATYSGGAFSATKMYTRSGDFTTDGAGNLMTRDGYYVVGVTLNGLGQPNPVTPANETLITIPANAQSVTIGADGIVVWTDSAGNQTKLAAITLSKFANQNGLMRSSGNLFTVSPNVGTITDGTPGDANGLGSLVPGALEMSNVDLAAEFTNLITAERGFQANSRVITTSDDMLQELVTHNHSAGGGGGGRVPRRRVSRRRSRR